MLSLRSKLTFSRSRFLRRVDDVAVGADVLNAYETVAKLLLLLPPFANPSTSPNIRLRPLTALPGTARLLVVEATAATAVIPLALPVLLLLPLPLPLPPPDAVPTLAPPPPAPAATTAAAAAAANVSAIVDRGHKFVVWTKPRSK